jgi:hypothetical protein
LVLFDNPLDRLLRPLDEHLISDNVMLSNLNIELYAISV